MLSCTYTQGGQNRCIVLAHDACVTNDKHMQLNIMPTKSVQRLAQLRVLQPLLRDLVVNTHVSSKSNLNKVDCKIGIPPAQTVHGKS